MLMSDSVLLVVVWVRVGRGTIACHWSFTIPKILACNTLGQLPLPYPVLPDQPARLTAPRESSLTSHHAQEV